MSKNPQYDQKTEPKQCKTKTVKLMKYAAIYQNLESGCHSIGMSENQELRDCFSELIQPLVTNECLEQMFEKLKEEIVTMFEERFIEQNKKIDELQGRV